MVLALAVLLAARPAVADSTNVFVVTAYNVANWTRTDRDGVRDQPKPIAEREAVVQVLAQVRPDVLGVQEIGTTNDLAELADRLAQRGLTYPYREWIEGADFERHVALLSRFPIARRFSRTDYHYTQSTNRFWMSRGVLDVAIQVNDQFSFRAVVAHLKSRRVTNGADQAEMREAEARLLRGHIDSVLEHDPETDLLVIGDLNDTPGSEAIRTVLGTDPFRLVDLRPVDSHGGTGTHYWRFRQQFSRIDYLLASPALAKKLVAGSARIADGPGWLTASDHRALSASFAVHPSNSAPRSAASGVGRTSGHFSAIGLALGLVVAAVVSRRWLRRR